MTAVKDTLEGFTNQVSLPTSTLSSTFDSTSCACNLTYYGGAVFGAAIYGIYTTILRTKVSQCVNFIQSTFFCLSDHGLFCQFEYAIINDILIICAHSAHTNIHVLIYTHA
jgi:hypothetical protein